MGNLYVMLTTTQYGHVGMYQKNVMLPLTTLLDIFQDLGAWRNLKAFLPNGSYSRETISFLFYITVVQVKPILIIITWNKASEISIYLSIDPVIS